MAKGTRAGYGELTGARVQQLRQQREASDLRGVIPRSVKPELCVTGDKHSCPAFEAVPAGAECGRCQQTRRKRTTP